MKFEQTVIAGVSYHLPERVFTSSEIEDRLSPLYQRLKLPFGRLQLMTGIRELRYWPPKTSCAHMAVHAAENLLRETGFPAREIDLLINASVCRDFLEPASASLVHAELGLSDSAMMFDLSNACLGVLNAMVVAAHMIERGQIGSALIVSGENSGPLLFNTIDSLLRDSSVTRQKFKRFVASLTIGSAATAVLLLDRNFDPKRRHVRLTGGAASTSSNYNHLCRGGGDLAALSMQTDSEALLKAGIELARLNWQRTLQALQWTPEEVDWALGHQVGEAHQREVMGALGLRDKKTLLTYPQFGNTGSSALPLTLAKLLESPDRPLPGDKLVLLGIGSGLASLMLGLEI